MTNILQFRKSTSTLADDHEQRSAQQFVVWVRNQAERWLESAPPTASQDAYKSGDWPNTAQPTFSLALITTFAPEPYEVKKVIHISIYGYGDEYTASFFDAKIHTTGENEQEAFDNIKSLILDMFDGLISRTADYLGPEPKRQLAILQQFISKAPSD